jgi:hypothetical protein
MSSPADAPRPSPTTRYARSSDVVWRAGPDRVLLRRIGGPIETAATDLIGDVAYLWIALDTPATSAELAERLADAGIIVADLAADVQHLVDHALITEHPPPPGPTQPEAAVQAPDHTR